MLRAFSVFLKRPLPATIIKGNGFLVRQYCADDTMRILNVAEKNDAAKTIASILSDGMASIREGPSRFNKIYEFRYNVFNRDCQMIMTSVCGHVLSFTFRSRYRNWNNVDPIELFDVPIIKNCLPGNENIVKNLENEVKYCNTLILWTDCDREGENIGFEIIRICKHVKPNLEIFRANFSEITFESITKALRKLGKPNKSLSDAVDVRQELDLRIGASFTRFQSILLRKAFPSAIKDNVISYGSCQFPTMGFIIQRFKEITDFVPENFWKIVLKDERYDKAVTFHWKRDNLFDKLAVEVITDKCLESKEAKVKNVTSKSKKKYRPKPLNTVELEKIISKKFRITAKETLKIAEKLYNRGFISYPRTETDIFPKEMNLVSLVMEQISDPQWGDFAKRILDLGPNPFQGKKSDQAHPPIHPLKYTNNLTGNEKIIYEFIVRHFLACLSKHAEGLETEVEIEIADEKFTTRGLLITARNYLDVYPYENWAESEIPVYKIEETFKPQISMCEGQTCPPELLTEADLIALMDKHGIGTDATHAEHIDKIQSRLYVGLKDKKYFVPRTLGMGLVEGYIKMGYEMSKPNLRAKLEADLNDICKNKKDPKAVLASHLKIYKDIFKEVQNQGLRLSETVEAYINVESEPVNLNDIHGFKINETVMKCPACQSQMRLKKTKRDSDKTKYFLGCVNFPQCKKAIWFPNFVQEVTALNDTCSVCGPDFKLLKFVFEENNGYLPAEYTGCVGGCDQVLINFLKPPKRMSQNQRSSETTRTFGDRSESNDSGYLSHGRDDVRSTNSEESGPLCKCRLPAKSFIAKASGPNLGRKYYKCGATPFACDFFEWLNGKRETNLDENDELKKGRQFSNSNGDNDETLHCYCAVPSRKLLVQKNGPNKGRYFFSCGKLITDKDKCNFFKWADNNPVI